MPGRVYIGVGGWTYAPWRGSFYPEGLPQRAELEYASRKLTSIEINGTWYGTQKPASFQRWHDETPEDFVFALKGPRFATTRRSLADAGPAIERFFASGVLALGRKLGPINWQFLPTRQFEPEEIERFLRLLPRKLEGQVIRHALEARHESFRCREFVALAREHGVAIVMAGDSSYPAIADVTADFVYVRMMGTSAAHRNGYPDKALDRWAARLRQWSAGGVPEDLERCDREPRRIQRDVFAYVISGAKERNPAAAMALIARMQKEAGDA